MPHEVDDRYNTLPVRCEKCGWMGWVSGVRPRLRCFVCREPIDVAESRFDRGEAGDGGAPEAAATDAGGEMTTKVLYPLMYRDQPMRFTLAVLLIPAFGLGLLVLLYWWLRCRNTSLTITNRRSTYRSGILFKHRRDPPP